MTRHKNGDNPLPVAGDSPLVQQRRSENDATVGMFLSYAFGS